ncbi:Permuted papain-like amidase enzyme, YaeF/YiiX, C92 family [Halobacillus karajensis]|uniref:Distant relative of cell wall-associated hydrolases n=1 Tax=Halobacillus karajensis TaxID=195088 RepID=A0A024P1N1_9BACI|nr:hypothetical protein [Halobacillus karajensis]CDQ19600.1 putative distant relative of cell wall-associated hydrolases [Halobacillus karajensis]CDQ22060.1 putative distant relative of cell wall-associated hydrolases [Halobacillus karajensis]CDQ27901.1 putative distant relative of cell wall-associated hydrolases [Halobacillus karajensis]SEH79710.1 Permuted papain-like amidase enzyme, YaeF/YiiX, C92 family [Halobacillus karajensis]
MQKLHLLLISFIMVIFFIKAKKVFAPVHQEKSPKYPQSMRTLLPGDLLFSPIGRKESRYIGHVGIVNSNYKVVHSVPAGVIQDCLEDYFQKFSKIKVLSPLDKKAGKAAGEYALKLQSVHSKAMYKIRTPIGYSNQYQYCTKIVWQSYFYGAGINLGGLSITSKSVHPLRIKDRRYLMQKENPSSSLVH